MGVEYGTAGPGLTSISPEEQRTCRIRLSAIRTGRLSTFGTESKWSRFLGTVESIQGMMYRRRYGRM
jgi:hypothetical protein